VIRDNRFPVTGNRFPSLEAAEHILALAAVRERDLERLKGFSFQN